MEFLLPDSPSAPLYPKFLAQSHSSAVLTWTPPTDFMCVSGFIITLINITEGNTLYTYNTTTNTTNLTVSDLTQGAEYSFTVAGVDTGGRMGEKSALAGTIIFDSEFVLSIMPARHFSSMHISSTAVDELFVKTIIIV